MQRNISLAALGLAGLALAAPALAQHTVRAQHSAPPRHQQSQHRLICSQHGNTINQSEWSTGNVAAHSRSKIFQTGPTGTFYFADAYHPQEMRGAIVVKP